jgi:hypothetical protein
VLVAGITAMSGGTVSAPSQLADITVNGVSIVAGPSIGRPTTRRPRKRSPIRSTSTPARRTTRRPSSATRSISWPPIRARRKTATPSLLGAAQSCGVAERRRARERRGSYGSTSFQAGSFAKTIRSKMYVTAAQYLNFSGILIPTGFETASNGAGFVDMSAEASGAEKLQAVAKYQKFIAIFAERITQIWYVDPDPTQNAQQQVLNNTGTRSPRSVTQFGDNDLFYLADSGVAIAARPRLVERGVDDRCRRAHRHTNRRKTSRHDVVERSRSSALWSRQRAVSG